MTFAQLHDYVLKLINQYSVAGVNVAPSYNNQQDYLNRIAALANDAMTEIATTARKIPVVLDLSTLVPEDTGKAYKYTLPDDFYMFKGGDTVVTTEEGFVLHTNRYTLLGKHYLLVPKREIEKEKHSYTVTYYRYPRLIDPSLGLASLNATELDNEPETHYAVAYYVASFLVPDDNAFLCSLLYNKYEDKLAKMSPGISAEAHSTVDAYSFGFSDVYFC